MMYSFMRPGYIYIQVDECQRMRERMKLVVGGDQYFRFQSGILQNASNKWSE